MIAFVCGWTTCLVVVDPRPVDAPVRLVPIPSTRGANDR